MLSEESLTRAEFTRHAYSHIIAAEVDRLTKISNKWKYVRVTNGWVYGATPQQVRSLERIVRELTLDDRVVISRGCGEIQPKTKERCAPPNPIDYSERSDGPYPSWGELIEHQQNQLF